MELKPFFSIVIPTKNRPAYLKDAIKSVLWQDFKNFELIVSDNYNEQATQDVIHEFSDHPNFRSVRTDRELNMINHWEFATQHAVGEYVIVLADRKVLYQNALNKIEKTIRNYPEINAFSFGVLTYNESINQLGWCNAVGKTRKFTSNDLLTNFIHENIFSSESMDRFFPKTLNGCYRNSFAAQVREKSGVYFNTQGVSTPDFSSFLINCALNNEVLYIGEKLILTQGEQTSNGRLFGSGKFQAYMESLGLINPYERVEIKAPLIYNLLMVDFLTIKSVFHGNLEQHEVNFENYYHTNYYEILLKIEQGLDVEGKSFFTEKWNEAITQHLPSLNRDEIIQQATESFNSTNPPVKWDKIRRFRFHLNDYLSIRFNEQSLINKIIPFKFKDIFQAAGFKK